MAKDFEQTNLKVEDRKGMHATDPVFSVILPTFNREKSLIPAVNSVLKQTFSEWELMIIDDGSTDGTAEVVKTISQLDPRIRFFKQENQGPSAARNHAIRLARGTFLAFLDSDDTYKVNHLEIRKSYIDQNPTTDFFYGGLEVHGNPWIPDRYDRSQMIRVDRPYIGACGTFIVRRTVAAILGGFPSIPYAEDAAFLERAIQAGHAVQWIHERTYIYNRDSFDSICTKVSAQTD